MVRKRAGRTHSGVRRRWHRSGPVNAFSEGGVMKHSQFRLLPLWVLVVTLAIGGTVAYAQGGATSTLAGTVTDSTGAVVPGADIVVKNNATGATFTAVSGASGAF